MGKRKMNTENYVFDLINWPTIMNKEGNDSLAKTKLLVSQSYGIPNSKLVYKLNARLLELQKNTSNLRLRSTIKLH